MDTIRKVNELFEEGTLALSDRIVGLIDDEFDTDYLDLEDDDELKELENGTRTR